MRCWQTDTSPRDPAKKTNTRAMNARSCIASLQSLPQPSAVYSEGRQTEGKNNPEEVKGMSSAGREDQNLPGYHQRATILGEKGAAVGQSACQPRHAPIPGRERLPATGPRRRGLPGAAVSPPRSEHECSRSQRGRLTRPACGKVGDAWPAKMRDNELMCCPRRRAGAPRTLSVLREARGHRADVGQQALHGPSRSEAT
jgi:hypothetical protein